MFKLLFFAMGALLLADAPLASAQQPIAEEHVEIDGTLYGPKLWRVADADSEVFILGTVEPLAKDLKWKSRQLDAVSQIADRGLTGEPSVSIGVVQIATMMITRRDAFRNPDKGKLSALLDAKTKAQYEAVRTRVGIKDGDAKDLEGWRPYIAGGVVLERAIGKVGLSNQLKIEDAALKKLRGRGKPVRSVVRIEAKPFIKALNDMPAGADLPCFKAQIDAADTKTQTMRQRADAWAQGDVAALRTLPGPGNERACFAALQASGVPIETLEANVLEDWTKAIKAELAKPGITLAVGAIDEFIAPGAVLDRLKAAGYTIEGP